MKHALAAATALIIATAVLSGCGLTPEQAHTSRPAGSGAGTSAAGAGAGEAESDVDESTAPLRIFDAVEAAALVCEQVNVESNFGYLEMTLNRWGAPAIEGEASATANGDTCTVPLGPNDTPASDGTGSEGTLTLRFGSDLDVVGSPIRDWTLNQVPCSAYGATNMGGVAHCDLTDAVQMDAELAFVRPKGAMYVTSSDLAVDVLEALVPTLVRLTRQDRAIWHPESTTWPIEVEVTPELQAIIDDFNAGDYTVDGAGWSWDTFQITKPYCQGDEAVVFEAKDTTGHFPEPRVAYLYESQTWGFDPYLAYDMGSLCDTFEESVYSAAESFGVGVADVTGELAVRDTMEQGFFEGESGSAPEKLTMTHARVTCRDAVGNLRLFGLLTTTPRKYVHGKWVVSGEPTAAWTDGSATVGDLSSLRGNGGNCGGA